MNNNLTNGQLASLLLRVSLGVNMLLHGAMWLPNLSDNVEKMAAGFTDTILPDLLARGFLYGLTFAEILIGLAILLGGPFGR